MLKYENEFVLVNAIVYGFYTVYVHPFADGNGRLSRAVMQKVLGVPALPLSKAIRLNLSDYYKSIKLSEYELNGVMNITAFADFMLDCILKSCDMFQQYSKPLSPLQSLLLSKVDKTGNGYFSITKAAEILGCNTYEASLLVGSLEDLWYVAHNTVSDDYRVIWQ